MKRKFLITLLLVAAIGLVCGPFLEVLASHCGGDCDCCMEVCNCQPQGCGSQLQPLAYLNDLGEGVPISLVQFDSNNYVFFTPEEPIRLVFHPPKDLA